MLGYLDAAFLPILRRAQGTFPIIDTITFHDGQIDYGELMELYKLVRGDELESFYWDTAQALQMTMNETFHMIINDEIGPTRASRRFNELWETFAQEIGSEMERQHVRRVAANPRRATPPGQ